MSENQQKKPDLGLLEEDDEFEEFPAEGLLDVGQFGGLSFAVCHERCNCIVIVGSRKVVIRVTTRLKRLEKSRNFKVVREKSGKSCVMCEQLAKACFLRSFGRHRYHCY